MKLLFSLVILSFFLSCNSDDTETKGYLGVYDIVKVVALYEGEDSISIVKNDTLFIEGYSFYIGSGSIVNVKEESVLIDLVLYENDKLFFEDDEVIDLNYVFYEASQKIIVDDEDFDEDLELCVLGNIITFAIEDADIVQVEAVKR